MAEQAPAATWTPQIGVVAIGRNEGERLVRCLESARRGAHALVYVDSGSTDRSVDAARRLGAYVVQLDSALTFTAARARNAGARALLEIAPDVQFIQFVDGDCELQNNWLAEGSEWLMRRPDAAVVCGRRRERDARSSIYNQLIDLEWDTPTGEALSCGGDALMRRSAFQQVGGFSEGLIAGEEPELCLRLRANGWKIWRLPSEMTSHDAAISRFRQWWLRNTRAGHAFAEVAALHWGSPKAIWKRELLSAFFWAAFVPACIVIGACVSSLWAGVAFIYPLQIARLAIRRGPTKALSWKSAGFLILAKFAEVQGAVIYYWRRASHRSAHLIEYKHSPQ